MSSDSDQWTILGLSCLGAIAVGIIVVIISTFITTVIWGWIVPQIFPGAVDQGILPATLTIVQAFKLSILFSFLGLTGASSAARSKTKPSRYSSLSERIGTYVLVSLIILPIWAILVVISGFLVSLVWNWVVPDVFSGAVAHGILPANLSLWGAILLSILFSVLGLNRHQSSSSDDKK